MAEALATGLVCIEDMNAMRESFKPDEVPVENHCILICNSPPYAAPVQQHPDYLGYTVDQLAPLFPEVHWSNTISRSTQSNAFIHITELCRLLCHFREISIYRFSHREKCQL